METVNIAFGYLDIHSKDLHFRSCIPNLSFDDCR